MPRRATLQPSPKYFGMVERNVRVAEDRGDMPAPADQLTITNLETLKVTADPLRMRVVELLRQAPATVKELAAALRVAPKSLYYHVNLLDKHGLIRVVDTRLVSGILEKRYQATAYLFQFQDVTAMPDEAGASGQQDYEAVSSMFTITREEVRRFTQENTPGRGDTTPVQDLYTDWRLLRLSHGQAAELYARIDALLAAYDAYDAPSASAANDARQTYRLLLTLVPTYRRRPPISSTTIND